MLEWIGEHWAQIITALVAVYGAALSTLNLINIQKEKKRQLSVKMSRGWLTFPKGLSGNMLLIEVGNPGYRPVTVQTPYIKLPHEESLVFPLPTAEVRFPHELQEGKRCLMWVEEAEVKRSLKEKGYSGKVKLRAEVYDQTRKKYRTKKALKFDLNG
jgi:hypothetical protein